MKHLLYVAVILCIVRTSMVQSQTWTSLTGPQVASNVKSISITTAGDDLYIADANFVLKSTNSGTAWRVTQVPYSSPLVVLVKPNDVTKVVVAKSDELRYSNQGGDAGTWSQKIQDPNLNPLRLVAAVNDGSKMFLGKRYHAQSTYPIYTSSNGGADWSEVSSFTNQTNISDFAPYPNNVDGWGAGVVWAGGVAPNGNPSGSNNASEATTSGLWHSTDYGATWYADRLGNRNVRSVEIVPREYDTHYIRLVAAAVAPGNDVLLRNESLSSSDPEDWTTISLSPAPLDIFLIRRKNSNGNIFLATSNGVWKSTNDGQSFTRVGLADIEVLSMAVASTGDNLFAGTSTTLYKSTNNGSDWTNVGDMNVSSIEAARAMKREGSLSGND